VLLAPWHFRQLSAIVLRTAFVNSSRLAAMSRACSAGTPGGIGGGAARQGRTGSSGREGIGRRRSGGEMKWSYRSRAARSSGAALRALFIAVRPASGPHHLEAAVQRRADELGGDGEVDLRAADDRYGHADDDAAAVGDGPA